MANMNEIIIGASYILAAKGNTPETSVKVIAVKGRWVKVVADFNGAEANVAAKDLTLITGNTRKREGELAKNGLIDPNARARYVHVKVDGVTHIDCGDPVASSLRGMELDEVFEVLATKLGVTAKSLAERWAHLNPGMQRMAAGNALRKVLRDNAKKA